MYVLITNFIYIYICGPIFGNVEMYPWNNVPLEFDNNKIMNMTGRHVCGPAGAHFGHTALSQHVGRTLKT